MRQPVPFGKYLLLDRISVGGMAEVFKAKSYGVEGFEKVIAIKRILPSMGEDGDFIKMFIDEAKIAGQLSHPNICQIFELGRVKKDHFIAMEYIWGKDLLQIQNRLRNNKKMMPVAMVCHIIAKVCEGLDYAHVKKDPLGRPLKIIHRDCSPQNVLVSYEGEVKIIDFGIAKAASRSSKTNAGVLKGKFGYMSPEQVRGLDLDQRSDIFAIGTVLYESLTGARLFQGESDFSTLERVRRADVKPPSSINANIPPEVEAIVMKALAADPNDRYQYCGDMRADLQKYLTGLDTVFTALTLAAWLRETFSPELALEKKQMDTYKKVGRDGLIAGLPQAQAELDVVSALGEAGAPEGDPTMLGGPNFDDIEIPSSPQPAGRSGRAPVGNFGDDQATNVAGEVDSAEVDRPPKSVLDSLRSAKTIALDDSLQGLAEEHAPSMPDQSGPIPRHSATPAGIPMVGSGAFPSAQRLPTGEFGHTTEAVPPLSRPFPLPVMRPAKKSSLVKDIGIGVAIAVGVLAIFIAVKVFVLTDKPSEAKPGVATSTLVVLASDGKPATVKINGEEFGKVEKGEPKNLALAVGRYVVELSRDGATPCIKEIELVVGKVDVVNCNFEPVPPKFAQLVLEGVTPAHRIFLDDEEISFSAATEAIKLEPGKTHSIFVRSGDTVLQEFSVPVQEGEKVRRKVRPLDPRAAKLFDKKERELEREREKKRLRDKAKEREKQLKEATPKDPTRVPDPPKTPKDKPKHTGKPTDGSGSTGDNSPGGSGQTGTSTTTTAKLGYLVAYSTPWAKLFIDGRNTGKQTPITPVGKISLKPGRHKVTLLHAGKKYNYSVTIRAGKTTRLKKTLN